MNTHPCGAASGTGLDFSPSALAVARERCNTQRADIKSWQARAGDAASRLSAMTRRFEEIAEERNVVAAKPPSLIREIEAGDAVRTRLGTELTFAETKVAELGDAARGIEAAFAAANEALASARESRAGAAARAENEEARRAEMAGISGERFQCPPPLLPERFTFEAAQVGPAPQESAEHDKLVADRERLGPVNLVAADELAEAETRHGASIAEQAELTEAVHRLRGSIGNLNREGRERLRAAFEAVDVHFRRLFSRLFEGGQAHLALVDSDDPLEAGLEIYAQPPGKRLQSLTLLSGGEQALTAVALIFSLFLTNPAPICVLDEVDAPLDDANIERFCDLLDAMVLETKTRYLIVTHNAVTMSRMHRLFGVTMVERGVSRLVSVDPKTVRRERIPDCPGIRQQSREIASERRQFGYRRVGLMLELECCAPRLSTSVIQNGRLHIAHFVNRPPSLGDYKRDKAISKRVGVNIGGDCDPGDFGKIQQGHAEIPNLEAVKLGSRFAGELVPSFAQQWRTREGETGIWAAARARARRASVSSAAEESSA